MKTTRFLNMMAASLVGVAFMSCSSQDDVLTGGQNVLTPAGQTYTMSVTAQKGGDGTRALTLVDGTTLKATWTEGDVVKVYNSTSELIGTLTAQSAGATTTLTGDLTKLPTTGDELTLKYLSPSYSAQDGTLTGADNSIDKVCDYATATVTATVSGTNVTTGAATFQNQQTVVKFTLIDKATTNTAISPTALTINDGTDDIVKLTSIPDATYNTNGAGVLYVAIPGFTGKTITLTATVGSDTYTCTTSEAKTLENGKYYGVTAKMAKQASVPTGALAGEFSVSSTKKVKFSKGNLCYASGAWSFFDNQYDYYTDYSTDAWDKFGWSTSANTYGMNTSTDNSYYSGDFVDWGATMGTGWRTLSSDEWTYLFNSRSASTVGTTEDARYAKATINTDGTGVNGVILFPDGATFAAGEATWGTINAVSGWETKCTTAQWTALEAKGCVFLPAAGRREGSLVIFPGTEGYYWSATPDDADDAYYVYFGSSDLGSAYYTNRYRGYSVRLVRDVAAPAPANKLLSDATAEDIGKIVGADGKIYTNVAAAQAASTTACAIIAYVGSATGESQNHGLAIAMKDAAAGGTVKWSSSDNDESLTNFETANLAVTTAQSGLSNSQTSGFDNESNYPAFYAALHNTITVSDGISAAAPASGTSGWFLPSLYQWNKIVQGLSGQSADLSRVSNDNYKAFSLNTKIEAAGGDGLQSANYWSSTEYGSGGNVWFFIANLGIVEVDWKGNSNYVRSAFAF